MESLDGGGVALEIDAKVDRGARTVALQRDLISPYSIQRSTFYPLPANSQL
jgi:hypothetical protein